MLESVREFKYTKLSPEEQKQRGILGRLAGTIADFKRPTRNERLYTEELWDKTFENPLMKEKLENKLLLGELGHPENRTEIDMEKVAICLAEQPVKCSDGTIKGVFDILDTPNGRILKTLCDYGCKIGVSSRGSGDVVEDFNGDEKVDPETYEMECWDAVLIPAVKAARPTYVTESLEKKSLKLALTEALEKSNPEDRKVMENTLKDLDIDITSERSEHIEEADAIAATDDGAEVLEQLQESLKSQESLELKVKSLQEQLSVCNAKEVKYQEEIDKYKNTVISLSESARKAKDLKKEVDSLNLQLTQANNSLNELKTLLKEKERINNSLKEKLTTFRKESFETKKEITQLKEQLSQKEEDNSKVTKQLNENLASVKQNSLIKSKQYQDQISKKDALIEHYKKIAQTSINKYVEVRAKMIGVNPNEITNRLNENYSFKDIDSICEDLRAYQLNISKLPFNVENGKTSVKMKITESKNDSLRIPSELDDTVDEYLINLAEGINK